jgi:uncharacterized protein (TIGR02246 family)
MRAHKGKLLAIVAMAVVLATAGWLYQSPATEKQSPPAKEGAKGKIMEESADAAGIRKSAEAFVKAFNSGDAKAVASFWMPEGEYTGPDGETLRGRAAIEKAYADFFKHSPKATVEVTIESIRVLGKYTALEEGTLSLKVPGESAASVSRYSVLHVREDDGWKMATVQDWVPDPSDLITLKDVEWLVGDWSAKSGDDVVSITYAWDEDRAFLRGRYTIIHAGKKRASGTHIIGKNPDGGLRAWLFDSTGSVGDSLWDLDDNRWVIEATGQLPDGTEVSAMNILVPINRDTFTWQSIERFVGDVALPSLPPVKVTRVKSGK